MFTRYAATTGGAIQADLFAVPLAGGAEQRVTDTPTMDEAGVKGFEMVAWQAVYAPKGTPKAVVDRLNKEIVAIVKTPEVREKMAATGIEVVGSSPEELTKFMQKEIPRWAELIRKSGAQPN